MQRVVRRRLFSEEGGDEPEARDEPEAPQCPCCADPGCPSLGGGNCAREGVRVVAPAASCGLLNMRANSLQRREVLEALLDGTTGQAWGECFLCNEAFDDERLVFVPGCNARHYLCTVCLHRSLVPRQRAPHYSCGICRARVYLPVTELWCVAMLRGGAEILYEQYVRETQRAARHRLVDCPLAVCHICRALSPALYAERPPAALEDWTPEHVARFLSRSALPEAERAARRAEDLGVRGNVLGAILDDDALAATILHVSPAGRVALKGLIAARQRGPAPRE